MHVEVDAYVSQSENWPEVVAELRWVLLATDATEDFKWRKPCYTRDGKNIAIIQEMNDFVALMFFKGALLEDSKKVLCEQGPNTRSAKRMEFTSVSDVKRSADTVAAYIAEAISVEEAGLGVGPAPRLILVEELQNRVDEDVAFREGYESLTPGRQREYNLHISGAKQAKTRLARVEKLAPRIVAGKGLRDR